ncbi:MAG: helix-turn-helix domain-containing protein [Prevotella sp.]|jgi:transcriptional regulator with XRE-family HTH domain|nr:helix-turn-helix domain-containing protein [Prevotella sp.]
MTINEIFGKRVREKRLLLNLSQEKLANMADIDRTYLPDIENGKRNVSLTVAEKIAKSLNVPLKDLIEDYA